MEEVGGEKQRGDNDFIDAVTRGRQISQEVGDGSVRVGDRRIGQHLA